MDEIVWNVASNSEAGSSPDVALAAGFYKLAADELKIVTGPLDEDWYDGRPTVTVALVTRTEGVGLSMIDYKGDGHFEEVWDTPPTETIEPLDAANFTVAEDGLYRMAWGGKGHVSLAKIG